MEYLLYGDWLSGIVIVVGIISVCWAITKLKDTKWPWQKF
jgi:hypothetical protein